MTKLTPGFKRDLANSRTRSLENLVAGLKNTQMVPCYDAAERLEQMQARIERLRSQVQRLACTCLPYAEPGDGMCGRCEVLAEDDNHE